MNPQEISLDFDLKKNIKFTSIFSRPKDQT